MLRDSCDHAAERVLPPHCYEVGGQIVVDDLAPDWHANAPDELPTIVPCKHCGAPLQFMRDQRMRVHRSWLIEKGYADPLAELVKE